jgi:hypothetical protein
MLRFRGDRKRERERTRQRLINLKHSYRSGQYVVGSYVTEVRCEGCQNIFPNWRAGRMRFCSRKCAGLDRGADHVTLRRRLYRRRYKAKVRAAGRLPKPCLACHRVFTPHRHDVLYCSAHCRNLAATRRGDTRDRSPRPCAACGVSFSPAYGDRRQSVCSATCQKRLDRMRYGKTHRHRARR